MFLHGANGDGEELVIILLIGLLMGAFCGAVPLVVGLLRGNKSMAWVGFGVCIVLGLGCWYLTILPAIVFTIIVAVTEPIEKRKKKGPGRRRRRRERADDFLDETDGPKRKREYSDRRRRRYDDEEDDDYDDRPRRRRRRDYDD